jgi:cell division septum initiation protein DivIVA
MGAQPTMTDRPFRRGIGGYRRAEVDRYVAEVEATRSAWSEELSRLRKVEPLARLGDDVANLLTAFASAVVALQDRLTEDAEQRRAEAEEYAARRMADADRLLELARQQAKQLSGEMIRKAQAEIAVIADQQLSIADALERAAVGIAVSKEAIAKIPRPALGVVGAAEGDRDESGGPAGAARIPRAAPPARSASG